MIETRCELKVQLVVTMRASLFCIWEEIYCRFGGTDVGCTLLRYVGEFLPDYMVSHPRTEFSLRRVVFGGVRIEFLTIVEVNLVRRLALTLRRLMSYIYGAPILDVSRSHTTTQHSR